MIKQCQGYVDVHAVNVMGFRGTTTRLGSFRGSGLMAFR